MLLLLRPSSMRVTPAAAAAAPPTTSPVFGPFNTPQSLLRYTGFAFCATQASYTPPGVFPEVESVVLNAVMPRTMAAPPADATIAPVRNLALWAGLSCGCAAAAAAVAARCAESWIGCCASAGVAARIRAKEIDKGHCVF